MLMISNRSGHDFVFRSVSRINKQPLTLKEMVWGTASRSKGWTAMVWGMRGRGGWGRGLDSRQINRAYLTNMLPNRRERQKRTNKKVD